MSFFVSDNQNTRAYKFDSKNIDLIFPVNFSISKNLYQNYANCLKLQSTFSYFVVLMINENMLNNIFFYR